MKPEYRLFTDEDGYVSVAAKKVGNKITVLARTNTFNDAFHAILEDAGLEVPTVHREQVKDYEPKLEDWN